MSSSMHTDRDHKSQTAQNRRGFHRFGVPGFRLRSVQELYRLRKRGMKFGVQLRKRREKAKHVSRLNS